MVVAQRKIKTSYGYRYPGEAVPEAKDWSPAALRASLSIGSVAIVESDVFRVDREYGCSECTKKFSSVKALNGHMRKHKYQRLNEESR